jgi:hypothetical protein
MAEDKVPSLINDQEEKEMRVGQELYEMTKTAGYQHLLKNLQDLAFHSWVDPREVNSKEDYLWRELNGFHAANNAKELLDWIQQSISRSEYIEKKKNGEVVIRPMKI